MQQWKIGAVTITRVVEMQGPIPGPFLFRDAVPERVKPHTWLQPHFANADGNLLASIHAFVLDTGTRRIMVDTCVGNDKVRTNPAWNMLQTRFLSDIAEAGYPRESIDTVVCTHLHVDHVGWNTMQVAGKWVPTFPKARYLFARPEWEHWSKEAHNPDGDVVGDSVRPIVDAGYCDLVEATHVVTDEIVFEPTHGHTPGHVSLHVRSRGADAVISGDMMHHPVQCSEPDWASNFDVDADAARATRRSFLARYADSPVQILGTHFATPTAGRIITAGNAWRFAVE